MNPLGLNPQSAAAMLGSAGEAVAPPPEEAAENPAEVHLRETAKKFSSAWRMLEDLNGTLGGDVELFNAMKKAAETWFADIASKVPASPQSPSY